jgi:hypothetical protein
VIDLKNKEALRASLFLSLTVIPFLVRKEIWKPVMLLWSRERIKDSDVGGPYQSMDSVENIRSKPSLLSLKMIIRRNVQLIDAPRKKDNRSFKQIYLYRPRIHIEHSMYYSKRGWISSSQ